MMQPILTRCANANITDVPPNTSTKFTDLRDRHDLQSTLLTYVLRCDIGGVTPRNVTHVYMRK